MVAPSQPEMFGAYRLVSRLARGGMAETWLAERVGARGVTKRLIIKRVLPNLSDNEKFINSFISEAKLSTTLSHGNIAQVFDFGEVNGEYFLAMEYVHGPPLAKLMKRARDEGFARMPVPIAIFVTMKMLEGLHYAHTRVDDDGQPIGVVHRDVSPENVMVSYEGEVKIIDFGIAKSSMEGRNETEAGVVKGKYHYFSPEQAMAQDLDGRSDVFAVAEVLYAMLCGRVPFDGPLQVSLRKLIQGKYPKPRILNPDVTPALEAIIVKALEKDREKRYLTARAMQEALGRYLFGNAPGFSSDDLRAFVQSLYRDELHRTGRTVELSKDQIERLSMWKSEALKVTQGAEDKLTESEDEQDDAAARDPSTAEGTGQREPGAPMGSTAKWALAAGAMAAVLLLGVGLYALGSSERSAAREVDPRLALEDKAPVPSKPAAVGAHVVSEDTVVAAEEQEEVDAGAPEVRTRWTAAWPETHLEVLAQEHVNVLPGRGVPSQPLDPSATYTLSEIVGKRSPPLYYALEDKAGLISEAGRFAGGKGPRSSGVKRALLFSPRPLPPSAFIPVYKGFRNILFDTPGGGSQWVTLTDNSASLDSMTAAAFTGLSPRSTYKLTLGKAVDLAGVAPLLLCGGTLDYSDDAPKEVSVAEVEGAWRVLKPGTSATFSGVRSLGCGFLDTQSSDNRGSVAMDLALVSGPESASLDPCERAQIAYENDKLGDAEELARVCFARSANSLHAKVLLSNVLVRKGKEAEGSRLRAQIAVEKQRLRSNGGGTLTAANIMGGSASFDRVRSAEAQLRIRDLPMAQWLFDACIKANDDFSCRCNRGMGDTVLAMGMQRRAGEYFEKFAECSGGPEAKKYAQLAARYEKAPR